MEASQPPRILLTLCDLNEFEAYGLGLLTVARFANRSFTLNSNGEKCLSKSSVLLSIPKDSEFAH
jgi:hypothetical protein